MFGTPSVGDHVRLRSTHTRWMGSDVKPGAFGIVRETHYGLLSSDVTVELADGTGRVRVPARNVRRTGGSGERGFELARDWHRAKLFAGFVLLIPVLFAVARFLISGGQPGDLVMPIFEGMVGTFFGLLAGPFGGIVLIVIVVLLLRHKLARRS